MKWFKNSTILALTCWLGSGSTSYISSSGTGTGTFGFSTSFAPFLGSVFAGGGAFFPLVYAYSSRSFFLMRSRFSYKTIKSSSVRAWPDFCFCWIKYRWRDFAAFSARPGSAVSQLNLRAFSLSSLSVSLISAIVSEVKNFRTHVIFSVYSFKVLAIGHRCKSKIA